MSSEYLSILQLTRPVSPQQLETAYKRSRTRYMRLTSRGPLRFYRRDLLDAVERAYKSLKQPSPQISARPLSLLARRAAEIAPLPPKPPVKSISENTSLFPANLPHIQFDKNVQSSEHRNDQKHSQIQLEDQFCREVIYRLEGDLIRFDSRRELLKLAQQTNIPVFRANLLIAQIVQAVRKHKLFEPLPSERLQDDSDNTNKKKSRPRHLLLITALAVLLAALIDWLIIRHLES